MKILKQIKESPFKSPKKNYYFGRIKHGTPYFPPMKFNKTIIRFRKLILKSSDEIEKENEKYPHLKITRNKFKNLPLVRRNKDWIFNLFGNYYFLSIGYPFSIYSNELGWKDKFNTPRHEWCPAFYIFFFKWQFCIWWKSPDNNDDKYYEMILWYLYYSDKDIKKAEETWGWVDARTKISTWNKNYLK